MCGCHVLGWIFVGMLEGGHTGHVVLLVGPLGLSVHPAKSQWSVGVMLLDSLVVWGLLYTIVLLMEGFAQYGEVLKEDCRTPLRTDRKNGYCFFHFGGIYSCASQPRGV